MSTGSDRRDRNRRAHRLGVERFHAAADLQLLGVKIDQQNSMMRAQLAQAQQQFVLEWVLRDNAVWCWVFHSIAFSERAGGKSRLFHPVKSISLKAR